MRKPTRRHRNPIEAIERRLLLSTTIYVDANASSPTHDGTSWPAAFPDLQQALAIASAGDEIHVADGVYTPTTIFAHDATFRLVSGARMLGGYGGDGAAAPDARDPANTPSVLSAEITRYGFSYKVKVLVTGDGTNAATVVDGFSLIGGGTCLSVNTGSPTISNCQFGGSDTGGATFFGASPTLRSCTFTRVSSPISTDNSSITAVGCFVYGSRGSGISSQSSDISLTNCVFVGNSGSVGSAIADHGGSNLTLRNCTLTANSLLEISGWYGTLVVSNSIIWGNNDSSSSQIWAPGDVISVDYSDIRAGWSGTGNINTNPVFLRAPSPGTDGAWGTNDDDYGDVRLAGYSPAVDAGYNSAVPSGITTDALGNPRFTEVFGTPDTGTGTAPIVDLGAFEVVPGLEADPGGPYLFLDGQKTQFAARGAAAVDGPLTYEWEWSGDGLFDDGSGQAPTFDSASYAPGQVIEILLRVTDAAAHSLVATTKVTIVPRVIHVDPRATGRADGTTWADAFTSLAPAVSEAIAGTTIKVATGIYTPTSTADRTALFQLAPGVQLLGGFAGATAPDPETRDVTAYPVVLSGDIGVIGKSSDNSKIILTCVDGDLSTLVDGFTFTAASGGSAALRIVRGNPAISNCIFTGNFEAGVSAVSATLATLMNCSLLSNTIGSTTSGAMLINNASPTLVNCVFSKNVGYAMYNTAASPTLRGCTFELGTTTGMYNTSSTPSLTDCSFTANAGTGMYNNASSPTLLRCDFTRNRVSGMANYAASAPKLYSCTFSENRTSGNGGGMFNQDSSPYLNCCVFRGNSGFWGGGFFSGRRGATVSSPTVLDCLFNGNSSTEFGGGIYDQTATSVINSVFIGNYSGADGGGVFAMSDAETINCTFVGNNADSHGGAAARGVLRNCILWGNSAHIQPEVSFATTSYCDIRGGDSGTGTIDSDPMFVRTPSPGPDLKWGTLDDDLGDLHPRCFSPVVDAGDSDALPDGVGTDFAGNSRFVDFPTVPDAITRLRPAVDIGAYELSANLHADAGGPYFAIPGENLTLHGHGIADSVGTLTFAWEWTGDGAFDDAIGQNPVIDISGMTVGEQRTIQLRVTDSLGQSVEDSSVLTIMPTVVYVDARASGAGDGTNWMNAFPRLSDALHLAVSGQTIKVAAGVYLPSSWGDTSASFILKNGVSLLGGFAGLGAPNPHTRDAGRYVTTLSGNFGHVGFEPDRSYHVIEASGTDATAVLDGFNITGGYAVYFGASFYVAGGGGLYAQSGSPTISNCVFLENGSMDRGGGAYFFYNSNPTLLNCKFIRNTADGDYGGGLCLVNNCHATLVDCEFLGNTVPNSGGALWIYYSSPTVVNCSFVGNRSKYGSALTLTGIYNYPKQTTTMVNCTITGNQPLVGDSIFDDGELLSSKNSILWGNIEPAGGVPAVDPRFVRNPSAGPDNTWGTADDDYGDLRLRIDSPCIDAGDNSAVPAGITTDIAGNPRFIDIPGVHDPGAIVDMGAYERIAPIADAGYLFDAVRPTVSVKFGFDALASSIAPSDLLLTNLTTGQALDCGKLCTVSYDSLTRTASWVFNAALPDGNYRAILPVNSVSDDTGSPALGANVTLDFFALGGDANRDRIVDINDLSILSMNWQGSNKLFSQGDFNYDGKVDAKDLGILSSHWQRSLPPPVPTAPVRAPTRTPVRIATLVL